MLVTFQFPIADARFFCPNLDLRLPVPDWPVPATGLNPQFVHHFGEARERIREPDEAWPDEIEYCFARRGLRFDRLETRHAGVPGQRFRPRCAFRRLFSDGDAVVRVEIGIANRSEYPLNNLDIASAFSIIRDISKIPTVVLNSTGIVQPRPLLKQGTNLARLYGYASMNRASVEARMGLSLVAVTDPLILVELEPEEASLDVEQLSGKGLIAMSPASIRGAVALYCRLDTQVGIAATWIIQKGSATVGQLRSLRICLTRLHAEREILDMILKQIHRGQILNSPTQEAVNLLDKYFNERTKVVNRQTWAGLRQSEIVAAFDATYSVIRPALQSQLISRYEGARRQVWQKIDAYQQQRRATRLVCVVNVEKGEITVNKTVTVSGTGNIVNVAEYMSNLTNTVNSNLAESNVDEQVQSLIKELNAEIARIAPEVDPTQIKKMGKNIETLSKEAASDEPERRWYQLSLDGIKEAAQAVGAIAAPVVTIVEKLSPLLLR